MRKLENAAKTLDVLEEEIAFETKLAESIGLAFHPTLLIVALYRLSQAQLSLAIERGGFTSEYGSYEQYEQQVTRFEGHASLGKWIEEQPG